MASIGGGDLHGVLLMLSVDTGIKPYFYAYVRSETERAASVDKKDYAGASQPVQTIIRDARRYDSENPQDKLSLDNAGFELFRHGTALKNEDFYDLTEERKQLYYKEIEDLFLIRFPTAARVIPFHHTVRNAAKAAGGSQDLQAPVQGYAEVTPHTDSHPHAAASTFFQIGEQFKVSEEMLKGRFLYVNAWRNISDSAPIQNHHLAILDERTTVKPDDYVAADLHMQHLTIQQYRLNANNNSRHKWYYYPEMRKDEVLLFKQWDSDPEQTSRITFHCAVADPRLKPTSTVPPRESIEVRALVFFPDHTPNTIFRPVVEARSSALPQSRETCCLCGLFRLVRRPKEDESDKALDSAVLSVKGAIAHLPAWPAAAKTSFLIPMIRGHDYDYEKVLKDVVQAVVDDSGNHNGLKNRSKQFKQKLLAKFYDAVDQEFLRNAQLALREISNSESQ